jgi:TonB family protein
LIADPHTTKLARTPSSPAGENRSLEINQVDLQADGHARFKLIIENTGALEANLRMSLGAIAWGTEAAKTDFRNSLAKQLNVKRIDCDFGSPEDLQKPYRFQATGEDYGYASTEDQSSWALVSAMGPLPGPFAALLQEFDSAESGSKTSAVQPPVRAEDYYLSLPFILEREIVIHPPDGFRPQIVPELGPVSLGPLELTRSAFVASDGSVHVRSRLECVKNRFTAGEARAIYEGVKRLSSAQLMRISFSRSEEVFTPLGELKESQTLSRRDERDSAGALEQQLTSHVGQKLILLAHGNDAEVKLPMVFKPEIGPCDAAVEIRGVSHQNDELQFDLERIGSPVLEGVTNSCLAWHPGIKLTIVGMRLSALPEDLGPVWQNVLLTPDAYLALRGHPASPEGADKTGANSQNPPPGLADPRVLLQVLPTYTQEAKSSRASGTVVIEAIVGIDGLVHSPKILTSLGKDLDEQALRVLPLWRFEPGRLENKPVATPTKLAVSFSGLGSDHAK